MPEWRDRSAQYYAYGSRRNPTAGRTPNAAQVFCTRSSIVASAIERADMLKVSIDAPLPDRTALFLDVDGTLLDLAASPTAVVVPRGLVECIADIERGAVAPDERDSVLTGYLVRIGVNERIGRNRLRVSGSGR